jgi:hypothetical protein
VLVIAILRPTNEFPQILSVTSSEKVDKENRYNDFRIVALPYPGCEFFKEFRENNHSGDGLVYDWSHPQVDTGLGIPDESTLAQLKIDWSRYQVNNSILMPLKIHYNNSRIYNSKKGKSYAKKPQL